MSVKHRAAAIRPRRAVVGASTWRARIRGTTRTSSSRLWSPLSVSGRPSDATSKLDAQKISILYTAELGFSDSTGGRALEAVVDAGDTTVESCVAACQAKGYFLAGVEFGRECCEFLLLLQVFSGRS